MSEHVPTHKRLKDLVKSILPTPVVAYFTKGAARSLKVKRNIVLSLVIRCCNIAISFLLVPLTINYVNPTQYGIWITLSSIIAWFSFFDIGFGNGLRNKFAEAVAQGKYKLARVYVSTTYATLSIIIGAVLILFVGINRYLDWATILNCPPEMAGELSAVALIVFVFFSVQFVLQLVNVVLTANQEPSLAAIFKLIANLLSLLIIFVLTRTVSGDLLKLGFALGISPVFALAGAHFLFLTEKYRKYSPSLAHVRFSFAKNLMQLGLKFFVIQVSGIFLYSTQNIIITQLFSPTEVTPYNIAFKYFTLTSMLFTIAMGPLWSANTEAYVKRDYSWIKRTVGRSTKVALQLTIVLLFMVVLAPYAYEIWIGKKIQVPASMDILLACYVALNLFLLPYTYFINGTGKITLQLVQSVATALLNIPLAIFLARIPWLGINGIIIASIICYLPGILLAPRQYKLIVEGKAKGIWNK